MYTRLHLGFRLAWDLLGVVLPGMLAFATLAGLAPRAPRAHVVAGFVMLVAVAVWAVTVLGCDFPAWFQAALLLSLPLQAWVGACAAPRRRQLPDTRDPA